MTGDRSRRSGRSVSVRADRSAGPALSSSGDHAARSGSSGRGGGSDSRDTVEAGAARVTWSRATSPLGASLPKSASHGHPLIPERPRSLPAPPGFATVSGRGSPGVKTQIPLTLNRPGFHGDSGDWVSGGLDGRRQALMVGGLEFGRRDVAAGRMQPPGVPEGDPLGGGELDLLDRSPGALRLISSALYRPLTVSAKALSYESPREPTEPTASASARRSV